MAAPSVPGPPSPPPNRSDVAGGPAASAHDASPLPPRSSSSASRTESASERALERDDDLEPQRARAGEHPFHAPQQLPRRTAWSPSRRIAPASQDDDERRLTDGTEATGDGRSPAPVARLAAGASADADAARPATDDWRPLVPLVGFTVASKLFLYGNFRFIYSVASFLQTDWQLTASEMGAVLSAEEFAGAVSNLFMASVDRANPRWLCFALQLVSGLATGLAVVVPGTPSLAVLMLSRAAFGFAFNIAVVFWQTCVLENMASLSLRDRITSVIELPWSTCVIVLVPALSAAYMASGWRVPFAVLSLAIVALAPLNLALLPRARAPRESKASAVAGLRWRSGALAFNLSALSWGLATNFVFAGFSLSLSGEGLTEAQAGDVGLLFGVAEFVGALGAACFSGYAASLEVAALALAGTLLAYGLLRRVSVELAVLGVWLTLLPTEFGVLQRFSRAALFGEPHDASVLLGHVSMFLYVGRAVGAVLAPSVPTANGGDLVFAAALTALAAALSAISNRLKRGAEEAASRVAVSSVGDVDAADGSALTRA